MDLPFLDLTGASTDAASAPTSPDALTLAARGDWHAAAESFAAALATAERADDDVALAVALTNLGQARAHLGAMDESARLLARSVDARTRLLDAGIVGAAVVVRGLVDVAAVYAASGATTAARDALLRARTLSDGSDATLMYVVAQGLALLDADSATSPIDVEPNMELPAPSAFADLAYLPIDDEPAAEPIALAWEVEPEPIVASTMLDFMDIEEPALVGEPSHESLTLEPAPIEPAALPWLLDEPLADVPLHDELPMAVEMTETPEAFALERPEPTLVVDDEAHVEPWSSAPVAPVVGVPEPLHPAATPVLATPIVAPARDERDRRWWQRLGRRRA